MPKEISVREENKQRKGTGIIVLVSSLVLNKMVRRNLVVKMRLILDNEGVEGVSPVHTWGGNISAKTLRFLWPGKTRGAGCTMESNWRSAGAGHRPLLPV